MIPPLKSDQLQTKEPNLGFLRGNGPKVSKSRTEMSWTSSSLGQLFSSYVSSSKYPRTTGYLQSCLNNLNPEGQKNIPKQFKLQCFVLFWPFFWPPKSSALFGSRFFRSPPASFRTGARFTMWATASKPLPAWPPACWRCWTAGASWMCLWNRTFWSQMVEPVFFKKWKMSFFFVVWHHDFEMFRSWPSSGWGKKNGGYLGHVAMGFPWISRNDQADFARS